MPTDIPAINCGTIFRKKTRSDETVSDRSHRHGQICWWDQGDGVRVMCLYDVEAKAFYTVENFKLLRRERARKNRRRSSFRQNGLLPDREYFVRRVS